MAINLSPDVADLLLDKLGNDDDFRALFQSDPAEALRQLGPAAAAFVAAAPCLQVNQLAGKSAIRRARKSLSTMLISKLATQVTPHLDIGKR